MGKQKTICCRYFNSDKMQSIRLMRWIGKPSCTWRLLMNLSRSVWCNVTKVIIVLIDLFSKRSTPTDVKWFCAHGRNNFQLRLNFSVFGNFELTKVKERENQMKKLPSILKSSPYHGGEINTANIKQKRLRTFFTTHEYVCKNSIYEHVKERCQRWISICSRP